MIVLADHAMMSPSTSAVRLAASTRADLYSAVLAGLGVLSGPYYGGGSGAAAQLVRNAAEVGVERAVDEQLRWRGPLPGFGIPGYPDGDPRFKAIFPLLERTLSAQDRNLVNKLLACVARQNLPPPGIDLALALLVHSTGADPTFGPAIFGLARIAGWAAHYVEELAEPVNRYLPPVVSPEGKTLPPLPRAAHESAAIARSIRRSGTSQRIATATKKPSPT
jgi:citrate synthase